MRILLTTHYWQPHRGGIETVAAEHARWLCRLGHRVTVLTSRLPGDPETETHDGVTVHRIPVTNLLADRWGIPFPLFHPRLIAQLDRLVPEQDVVVGHGHVYLPSVLAALACVRHQRPFVLFQHNPFVHLRHPWDSVERIADRTLGGLSLRAARQILTPSRYTAAHVRSLTQGRTITVIPNGVDTSRFSPAPDAGGRRALRNQLGLPLGGFIVLAVRRLVYRNGLDVLLNAAALLQHCEAVHFVIGGRGPERALLARLIRERGLSRCHLIGEIAEQDLSHYYQAADLFVLPTRTGEGFGLVLLEAFASGLPAIAAGGGGQDEVIDAGRTGLLVPPEDAPALADAIAVMHRNPILREAMGAEALLRARGLDWEHQTARFAKVLEQVAEARPMPNMCEAGEAPRERTVCDEAAG